MRRGVLKLTKAEGELVQAVIERLGSAGLDQVKARLQIGLATAAAEIGVSVTEEEVERLQDCLGIPEKNESAAAQSLRKKLSDMFINM